MINHVRTLLLNNGQAGFSPETYPGEEVVPAYRPRQLSGALLTAHQLLFGIHPDRLFLNFRLAQLLGWLHATETGEYLTFRDSRLTYQPEALTTADWFQPTISDPAVQLLAPPVADNGQGWSCFEYRLTLAESTLQIQEINPVPKTTSTVLVFSGGLSAPINLPDSSASIRVAEDLAASGRISLRARPAHDLGQILAAWVAICGPALVTEIFVTDTPPFPELYQRWKSKPLDTERYAALLLAFAYHLESQPARSQ